MMEKTLTATAVGALALGGAALTPAEAATTPTSVDVYTNVSSFAPVPGLANHRPALSRECRLRLR